jgi:MSHA biogenesis protein MshP
MHTFRTCPDRDPARIRGYRHAGGFVLPTAVFLIVVMAALAAYMVRTFTLMRGAFDMSLQGVLAYQAALAGLEWGSYQALDVQNAWVRGNPLPACPATTTLNNLAGRLSGYTVTVSCTGGSTYTEGNHYVAVYRFTSVAKQGTAGTVGYVERDAQTLVILCKDNDPSAAAPYSCR